MQCTFLKSDKTQCNAHAMNGSQFCWLHNPDISDEAKKEAQAQGGKASTVAISSPLPPVKLNSPSDVVSLLEDTINRVRSGEIDVRVGNCIGVLSNQILKALEITTIKDRVEVIERAIFERKTSYKK